MPAVGPFISLIFLPLGFYLVAYLLMYPEYLGHNLLLLFSTRALFGQIIAVAGLTIFIMACIQFLRKRGKLNKTGLYSTVRHPQYLGIMVMTLGMSVICIQLGNWHKALHTWLIQVLGYLLLARYEEHHLLKEYDEEYRQYRQRVPFIFPVPRLTKIPEPLFSMILALITAFLCTLL